MANEETARVVVERILPAAPAAVFAAWLDRGTLREFIGPGDANSVDVEVDPRVGGRYRIVMHAPNGEEYDVGGVYREVVANEKLVFTWAWKSTPERESLVTLLFKPDGDGTLLTLTHEQFSDEESRDNHKQGWHSALDKLESFVA